MRLRIALGGAGVLLGLFGVFRLLTQVGAYDLFVLACWLVGAVVIHDGLLSPVVAGVGTALRRLPARARRFVQFGLTAGALVTVVALPLVHRQGSQPASKAILTRDYSADLGALLGLIAVASLAGYAVAVARRDQRASTTKSRDCDDQNSDTR